MSATDHLNTQQFDMIPTEEVGYMASGDFGGTVEGHYQAQLAAKAQGYGDWPIQQQELHEDIRKHGIRTPIELGPGNVLHQGHHRYYEARRLGIPQMPYKNVSDNDRMPYTE